MGFLGKGNFTSLYAASEKGFLLLVKLLVANKAEINLRTKDDDLAVIIAAQHGQLEVVKFLVENGANVNEFVLVF